MIQGVTEEIALKDGDLWLKLFVFVFDSLQRFFIHAMFLPKYLLTRKYIMDSNFHTFLSLPPKKPEKSFMLFSLA